MIILDANKYTVSPRVILFNLKRMLYINYIRLKENKSETILMISDMFSDKEIRDAINSIYLDRYKRVISDGQSKNDKILRYLEYGGENVKAPHLISKIVNHIERRGMNV